MNTKDKLYEKLIALRKEFPNNQEFGNAVAKHLEYLNKTTMTNAENTAKILEKYLGEELKSVPVLPSFASYLMEYVFGENIHLQVDGFVNFCEKDDTITFDEIKVELSHDVGGALKQDKLMLPRVSHYEKYTNLKK